MPEARSSRAGRVLSGPRVALIAEAAGTALLVLVGLSIVILAFGSGSPGPRWIPDPGARRALTGFLFGCTGAAVALSPLGKHSGAHLNPAVTLMFVLTRTMRLRHGAAYVLVQLVGAAVGAVPLLAWGRMGWSVELGATVPGSGVGVPTALEGELASTFLMIVLLVLFLRHAELRRFTPGLFPPLYSVLVFLEAPLSGTSTNPARSFGPALVAGEWRDWWIYWVGPLLGALLAVALLRSPWLRFAEIEVAKLYHFGHDPHGIFHRSGARTGGRGGRGAQAASSKR